MASETTLAALSGDVAEAAASGWILLLADRNSLADLPTLHYAGMVNDRLTNTLAVEHAGLFGYDIAAAMS
jgi:hypothetical protein